MMRAVTTRLSDAQQHVMHSVGLDILAHEFACHYLAGMSERAVQGSHLL